MAQRDTNELQSSEESEDLVDVEVPNDSLGESENGEICDERDQVSENNNRFADGLLVEELEEIVLKDDKLFERIMMKKRNELKVQMELKNAELNRQKEKAPLPSGSR